MLSSLRQILTRFLSQEPRTRLKLKALSGVNEGKATYLHAMDSQARASVQLLVANMAFKMLCLLMLNEDLLVVEVSITVPLVIRQGMDIERGEQAKHQKIHHTEFHQGR